MDPTLNVIEPTPYYDYEDDMLEDDRVVTRKQVLDKYEYGYGEENDVKVVDDEELFVNEDGFVDEDEGKYRCLIIWFDSYVGFGGNYHLNRVGD